MNQLGGFPLLTLIVFLPVLGAAISLFIPRDRPETLRWLALLIAASDLFITLFLYMGWVDDTVGAAQFVDGPWAWIAGLGMTYQVGVDGINLHLMFLTALVTPLVMIFSWTHDAEDQGTKERVFWVLLLEAGLLGAFASLDLILLSVFWLLALLAAFFLAGQGSEHAQAAVQLVVAAALVAAALLAVAVGLSTAQAGFGLTAPLGEALSWRAQRWMFWVLAAACGITGAAFPLHLWYPTTNCQMSTIARVLVGSLLPILGGYGLIRLCLQLFPTAADHFAPSIIVIGTIGLLYGALAALGQDHLADTLAYWRIAQTGLIVVGIFTIQDMGIHGAIVHMVGCSMVTATLSLLCTDKGRTPDRTAGPAPSARSSRAVLALVFLSAIGMPGLIGFVGQGLLVMEIARWRWQDIPSATGNSPWDWAWRAAIVGGLLLGTWALLRAWRRAAAAPERVAQRVLTALPILILILVVGIAPRLASDVIGLSVHRLLVQVRQEIGEDLDRTVSPEPPEAAPEPTITPGDSTEPARFSPFLDRDDGEPFSARRPAHPFRRIAEWQATGI